MFSDSRRNSGEKVLMRTITSYTHTHAHTQAAALTLSYCHVIELLVPTSLPIAWVSYFSKERGWHSIFKLQIKAFLLIWFIWSRCMLMRRHKWRRRSLTYLSVYICRACFYWFWRFYMFLMWLCVHCRTACASQERGATECTAVSGIMRDKCMDQKLSCILYNVEIVYLKKDYIECLCIELYPYA